MKQRAQSRRNSRFAAACALLGVLACFVGEVSLAKDCQLTEELVSDGLNDFKRILSQGTADGDLVWKIHGASRCYMQDAADAVLHGTIVCIWQYGRFVEPDQLREYAKDTFGEIAPCLRPVLKVRDERSNPDPRYSAFYMLLGDLKRALPNGVNFLVTANEHDRAVEMTFGAYRRF